MCAFVCGWVGGRAGVARVRQMVEVARKALRGGMFVVVCSLVSRGLNIAVISDPRTRDLSGPRQVLFPHVVMTSV